MKCPKCGYNSFEYNDICTKCSNDLSGFKQTYGLAPLILPSLARVAMADSLKESLFAEEAAQETVDHGSDMFSFDLPDDELASGTGALQTDDPFNFDSALESPAQQVVSSDTFQQKSQPAGADDPFADLLEQTSPASETAVSAGGTSSETSNEFDLENFSWDDTPVATGTDTSAPEDEFDSLFGDNDAKKQ